MSVLLTILAVIVIFSFLVLIHELGHFVAARRAGIRVLEFGIGFPPRLFGKKRGETLYSINAVPFGGFVKLYGEDATRVSVLKDKKSFASKSPWVRTKVVTAGVLMNFTLAIALLTLGFSFGIEPLLLNENDFTQHLAAGNIRTAPGVFVEKVEEPAASAGIASGDQILTVDDRPLTRPADLAIFQKGGAKKDLDLTLRSKGALKKIHLPVSSKKSYGISLKPYTDFPRLTVLEVKPQSAAQRAGILPGDIIMSMNGEDVAYPADFETILAEADQVKFFVLRGNEILSLSVSLPDANKVVIAEIFPGSRASEVGFAQGDVLVSIDGVSVTQPKQVQDILRKNQGKPLHYRFLRSGRVQEITASSGEGNVLGVALSAVASFRNNEISFYRSNLLTSVLEIKKVRYNPWKAFRLAIAESVRLTGLTVQAFGRSVTSLISRGKVPAEIGGPVQIAYYTHAFVKEGFFALLRFTALLSLSLAVMNILPIPALDGGRLLFIVIEAVIKRRVSARLESLVHSFGFVLLIAFILVVTYSDIRKLL